MSKHRFEIVVEVDDEALAEHDGDQSLPPNDVNDWEFRDLVAAVNNGIVDEFEAITLYSGEARVAP